MGQLGRAILTPFWYRTLRHPAILPVEYLEIAKVFERARDLTSREALLDDDYWAAQLRKYAHILDKGVQRCDCEPGHSRDFYKAALNTRERIHDEGMKDDPSIIWAFEKIRQYELLQKEQRQTNRPPFAPLPTDSYSKLIEILRHRRSNRNYTEQMIDQHAILKILEVVNWGPKSCNRQTTKIFVATEPKLVSECLAQCEGATGFSNNIPCFLSFCADLRPYLLPREMGLPYVDVSLGAQNCCLVASTLGISLTLLSWSHHSPNQDSELRRLLKIPDHLLIVFNGVMGYPQYDVEGPSAKSVNNTVLFVK